MRSFGRRVPPWSAALAAYLLLAFLLFLPVWLPPGQRTVGGGGGDPFFSSWFIRWFPHAISHGWNPLFTTYLDYPDGVNLMWNGSIALPSVLLAPVTLSAGPMVAYNLLTTLGLALSGWCAYLAISRYARNRLAAFIGGALYAFSPFMISQSLGHAHLTMAWAPPLALLLLDELLVRRRRSLWIGVALGALGATQLLTAEEVLAIVAVAAAVGLIVAGLLHRQVVWSRLQPALPALGLAAVVFLGALLCHFHHHQKTYEGYRLEGEPGRWRWIPPPQAHAPPDGDDDESVPDLDTAIARLEQALREPSR